jgi:dihydroorotase
MVHPAGAPFPGCGNSPSEVIEIKNTFPIGINTQDMKLLIQKARIIDPNSPATGKVRDLLIENGVITTIKENIPATAGTETFSADNLHASPGWFDLQANFRDPGFEHKEDLQSGAAAAAAGGFTGAALMPSTNPPVHSKSEVEYIMHKGKGSAVDLYPIGTLSHRLEGKELSEMYDMHLSGAVAFSDDKSPIKSAGLLVRAMLYAKNFNKLIFTHCEEPSLSIEGKMHEGVMSTQLGMKGIPALAEEVMLARNIQLAEYAEAAVHISSVSTRGAVAQIRMAKAKGIKITASVNAHHLGMDDTSLSGFDSNLKVNPPLRSASDIRALKEGLADGTIDVIASDHSPEDTENKVLEFDHAAFGMIGLETAYALANTYSGLNPDELVMKFAINPRKLLGQAIPCLKEGSPANITFFNPALTWTFQATDIRSKSKNTPFVGHPFKGKALGIYNNGIFVKGK